MMSVSLSQTYTQTDHTQTDSAPRDDVGVTLSDLHTDTHHSGPSDHTQT